MEPVHIARCDACEEIVLRGIERVDPGLRDNAPHTFWGQLVTDRGC